MTVPIISERALFQMAVEEKEREVVESAMAKASGYVGKNLTFDQAFRVSRCISKFAFAAFKRDLLAQYPSKEYRVGLECAFSAKRTFFLGRLRESIQAVILPEEADSSKDLKDRPLEVISTKNT